MYWNETYTIRHHIRGVCFDDTASISIGHHYLLRDCFLRDEFPSADLKKNAGAQFFYLSKCDIYPSKTTLCTPKMLRTLNYGRLLIHFMVLLGNIFLFSDGCYKSYTYVLAGREKAK